MYMSVSLYRGDVVYSADMDHLSVVEGATIAVENGFVKDIYTTLPEEMSGLPVKDYGRALIIPAFSDLHIHASQYVQRGIGMDKLLFDWLNDYTFPQEARFKDPDYARAVYDAVAEDLIRNGTFHASLFTTIHNEASGYLFDTLSEKGLYAYVGKVNMDRNSPDYLREDLSESLRSAEQFLAEHSGSRTVKPILTPRFAPTCSPALLEGLGKLAQIYKYGMQTHLVESIAEKQWALELFPEAGCDAEIYARAGLLDHGPVIFAHVIFPSEEDEEIIRDCSAVSVHCPDATANITAGIMPVAALQGRDLPVALGSDIGAGSGTAVYRQISRAVQLSKLKEFFEPEDNSRISFARAFYMATAEGGRVFDRVGSLAPGYRFNALVIDGLEDAFAPLSPEERLERFCYAGDDRNIKARYLDGKPIGPAE